MRRNIFFAVLLVLIFSSLAFAEEVYVVKYSQEIKADLKNTIQTLDSKIITSLEKNDPTVMYNFFNAEAKKQGLEEVKKIYSMVRSEMPNYNLQMFNEYYVTFLADGEPGNPSDLVNVNISSNEEDIYFLNFKAEAKPTYLTLYTTTTGSTDYMLSFIWVQEKTGWQLQSFNINLYALAGKTGLYWFTEAKQFAGKGYDAPAMLNLAVGTLVMNPAPFFQYNGQYEIMSLINQVQTSILERVSFPLTFPQVKTKPEVYSIEPQLLKEGLFPSIQYVTKISLKDTAALQAEAEALSKELESVFPGITKMSSHIIFNIFSEAPTDPSKQYNAYTVIVAVSE